MKLERYLNSILNFVKQASELRPDLYVQFRMWNQGADESALESHVNRQVLATIEKMFNIGVDFTKIQLNFKKSFPLGGRFSIQFDSRFRWPNINDEILTQVGFCHALSSHLAIHADGKIVPCCLDKEAKIELGNIYEIKFSEVLKSNRFQQMKAGFARGERCESLCQRCQFIQRFAVKASRLAQGALSVKELVQ